MEETKEAKSFENTIRIAVPIKPELRKKPCFDKIQSIHITAVIFSFFDKQFRVIRLCQELNHSSRAFIVQ